MVFRLVLTKGQTCSLVAVGANESPMMQQSLIILLLIVCKFANRKANKATALGQASCSHATPARSR